MVTIFDTPYTFSEIDGLKSDFLIGYNLLKKIGAVIDTEKGVIKYGGKEENLIYDNDSSFNQLSLSEEKTILPLKEFIIRKYFDEKAKIRTESESANQSKISLGLKYPEHAVVEVSDKYSSLGFKNPERAVVEISDKNYSLGLKSPEQAVVDLSDNNEINNMSESKNQPKNGFGK